MNLTKNKNGFKNAIIPAILLQLCAGSCYCFSIYRSEMAKILQVSDSKIGWMFTAIIFFLGMFAAFSGKKVEKDVHASSRLAALLLPVGMLWVGVSLFYKTYLFSFLGFCIMGAGVGLSYVSPVKTLALWFPKKKGLATAVSIASFGLSKTLLSPIMEALQNKVGTIQMFTLTAVCFGVLMYIGHLLLAKPDDWIETDENIANIKIKEIILDKRFIGIFIMFLISITNGLCLIGIEKQLLLQYNVTQIGLACGLTAVFNFLGRIVFSSLTDKMKNKKYMYEYMGLLALITTCASAFLINFSFTGIELLILLCIINAVYGGFFSVLVPILAEIFGIERLSTIHSCELVAWSLGAILSGIITAMFTELKIILYLIFSLYFCAIVVFNLLLGGQKNEKKNINN